MHKSIERTLQLIAGGDLDGAQRELAELDRTLTFMDKLLTSAEEGNKKLVAQNNEFRLAVERAVQNNRDQAARAEARMTQLQEQLVRVQVDKQAELQGLVEGNVKLQRELRALKNLTA